MEVIIIKVWIVAISGKIKEIVTRKMSARFWEDWQHSIFFCIIVTREIVL
jgi:hypothetical protein